MEELSKEEIRNKQLRLLDVLLHVCRCYKLKVFVYYGTLIGTVRHGGFIPWDDDIDVAMPRNDYKKLESLNWSQHDAELISCTKEQNSPYANYKLSDANTVLIDEIDEHLDRIGVNIDIFPIDNVTNNNLILSTSKLCINIMKLMLSFKVVKLSSNRKVFRNISLSIGKMLMRPVSAGTIARSIDKLSSNNEHNTIRAGSRLGPYGNREIFEKTLFHEIKECNFEGRRVPAPKRYDEILKGLYGDYKTLPPKEKRVSHHAFKAYHRT